MSDTCNYGGGNCGSVPTVPVPTSALVGVPKTHAAELPFTGGDVVGLSLFGVGLLAAGIALWNSNRRRPFAAARSYVGGRDPR